MKTPQQLALLEKQKEHRRDLEDQKLQLEINKLKAESVPQYHATYQKIKPNKTVRHVVISLLIIEILRLVYDLFHG